MSDSICWSCKKSGGGCSWSKRLEPVKGWDAKEDHRNNEHTKKYVLYSYTVLGCPEYERGNVKEYAVNDDALGRMITELGEMMAKDYAGSLKRFLKKPSDESRFTALKAERDSVLHGFLSETGIATDKFLNDLTNLTVEEIAKDVLINMKQRDFNKLLKEREKKEKQ